MIALFSLMLCISVYGYTHFRHFVFAHEIKYREKHMHDLLATNFT